MAVAIHISHLIENPLDSSAFQFFNLIGNVDICSCDTDFFI